MSERIVKLSDDSMLPDLDDDDPIERLEALRRIPTKRQGPLKMRKSLPPEAPAPVVVEPEVKKGSDADCVRIYADGRMENADDRDDDLARPVRLKLI